MKKLMLLLLSAALALAAFTGCDKSTLRDSAGTRAPRESTTTAGERMESKLTEAGDRLREGLTDASEKFSEGVSGANETLSRAAEEILP